MPRPPPYWGSDPVEVTRVVAGEAGSGGLRAALRAPDVRNQIRAALTTMLEPGAEVDGCRLRRTKLKPGRKLTAWFDVASGPHRRAVAVAWWADPGAAPPVDNASEAEAHERDVAAPFRHLFVDLPGGPRVQVAPFDPDFPRLVAMSDPGHAAAVSGLARPVTVRTVRYRPGQRHVLRYGPHRGGLYAKLYRDGGGADAARLACSAAELVPEAPAEVRWVDGDRAVLVAHAPGARLSTLLGRDAAYEGLAEAGRILRRVHALPPAALPGLPTRTGDAEVRTVARACEALQVLLPDVGAQVRDTLARTTDLMATLPAEDPVFLHGDYKSDHLLIGAATTLIDFDRCGVGDPALDVAKFMADLRWWLRGPRLVAAQRSFLEGYGDDGARLIRARALEPLFSVKLTARRVRLHDSGWEARAGALVSDAANRLRDLVPA